MIRATGQGQGLPCAVQCARLSGVGQQPTRWAKTLRVLGVSALSCMRTLRGLDFSATVAGGSACELRAVQARSSSRTHVAPLNVIMRPASHRYRYAQSAPYFGWSPVF